eukprot:TRINITY_DN15575_c0_g1_i1.p1 TRINITY_DN15575_c0_g1~~TRINITY_DN15575_c0_g1_i1.p1  ORF type:complete len:153 (-),score=20.94 TRINITY_DN15575_c0_g1_i1:247-705(-)
MIFYKKKDTEKSYSRYLEFANLVDACVLDIESLNYDPKMLILSILYIISGMYMKTFTFYQVKQEFIQKPQVILDDSPYNQIFAKFLQYFNLTTTRLLQCIQFVSQVISISQYPNNILDNLILNSKKMANREELSSYQNYNPSNIENLKMQYK